MRKALVIGIDNYPESPLSGCVNDAKRMAELLKTNGDGSPNFGVELLTSPDDDLTRVSMRKSVSNLFASENDVSLLYFAGHGSVNSSGGFLETVDGVSYDEGMSMDEVLLFANNSPARNKIIILDCCHSGTLGAPQINNSALAQLSEGLTVLAASRSGETAAEKDGFGVFTALVSEALQGGAADIIGHITPGAIYTFVDQALGPWDQRPIFKSNVSKFTSLRSVPALVPLATLRNLTRYFSSQDAEIQLDPSYEYTSEQPDDAKVAIFKELQKFHAVGLVLPVGAEYMYYAAMDSKACQLTAKGKQYWRLANEEKL